MRYRLLCLDAGFTLLAPRRTLSAALSDVLAEHGHVPTDEELHAAWEAADRWFWDEYHRPDNDTWGDDARINDMWRRFHGVVLGELGMGEAPDLVERILGLQFTPAAWELYPDVEELFDALATSRRNGLRVGVVSDWNSTLPDIFGSLGIEDHLDFILASGAVGVAKPDPAFFRLALDMAGVEPDEAIMVGDSYRADVVGARAAGMAGVLIDRDGHPVPPESPTPIIRTLLELPAIIAGDAELTDARPAVQADA